MRKKIVAGNWKMNLTQSEAINLTDSILEQYESLYLDENKICILAPSFVFLNQTIKQIEKFTNIYVAAQNCSAHENGAYTGEVSTDMLDSIGVKYVIIGHSERRQYFNETDEILLQKIKKTISKDLLSIFCCGEPLEIREAHTHFDFIQKQLENCLFKLSAEEIQKIAIAYEPIWAIGTGKTATPAQAQEVHQFIRENIAKTYNQRIADSITILYGGSVSASNAQELFAQADIDGGLVGGASLKADEFIKIIKAR